MPWIGIFSFMMTLANTKCQQGIPDKNRTRRDAWRHLPGQGSRERTPTGIPAGPTIYFISQTPPLPKTLSMSSS